MREGLAARDGTRHVRGCHSRARKANDKLEGANEDQTVGIHPRARSKSRCTSGDARYFQALSV
jgi:hypothetical protein